MSSTRKIMANMTASIVTTPATTTEQHLQDELPGYRINAYLRLPLTPQFISCSILVLCSLLLNSLVLSGLRRDRRLSAVTYNYVSSVCWAMLLQTVLCFPPGVLQEVIGKGRTSLMNTLCIAWIYMDTFLCNLVFLHCLGSTIDTWLRLRYPMRYAYSTTRGSTCLKLGAPWSVSFIQTTAEFAISKRHENLFDSSSGVCLHRDPNFVILRACMSYGVPCLASLLMLCLGFCQLASVRGQQDPELVSELIRSYHQQQRSDPGSTSSNGAGGSSSGVLDVTCVSEADDFRHQSHQHHQHPQTVGHRPPGSSVASSYSSSSSATIHSASIPRDCTRETLLAYSGGGNGSGSSGGCGSLSRDAASAYELYRMTPIPEAPDESVGSSACNVPSSRSCHTFKSGGNGSNTMRRSNDSEGGHPSGSLTLSPRGFSMPQELLPVAMTTCPVHSRALLNQQLHHHQAVQAPMEIPASAFSYDDDDRIQQHQHQQESQRKQRRHRRQLISHSWRRMLSSEKSACRLNLCAFAVSLVFWSPHSLGILLYCICNSVITCRTGLGPAAQSVADMKWIAYATCVAYPLFFLLADASIRRAAGLACCCCCCCCCRNRDQAANIDELVYGPSAASEDDVDEGENGTLADSQA